MINALAKLWNRSRVKAAISWHLKADGDARGRNSKRLQVWLDSEENRRLYDSVSELWEEVDTYRWAPELRAMRSAALQRMNISPRSVPRRGLKLALSFAVVVVLIGVIPTENFLSTDKPVIYSSSVGERRIVLLDDGSHIWLDANSAITVGRFSKHSRELTLDKGRARFDVAHDKTRPFTVKAGPETTVAVGTSFDVERLSSKIFVTLREGRVLVEVAAGGSSSPSPVSLSPGHELVAGSAGDVTVQNVDLQAANAWENGKIVLNDRPLSEAVEQINRYLEQPILVDPAIAKLRISGVFNAGDLHSFVSALTNYFPVQSKLLANGQILLEKRS